MNIFKYSNILDPNIYSDIRSYQNLDTNIFGYSFVSKKIMDVTLCIRQQGPNNYSDTETRSLVFLVKLAIHSQMNICYWGEGKMLLLFDVGRD